jgi:hypothetical protein
MRELHRAGKKKYMKTRAVTELRVIKAMANIVAGGRQRNSATDKVDADAGESVRPKATLG